jgi:hypothetical protein
MAAEAAGKVLELKELARVVNTFDVPPGISSAIKQVGLIELTADEELMATKRSRQDNVRLAYELAKQSLTEINGNKISIADGSADKAWNEMSPKLRNLVIRAYAELHAPPDEEADDFLKSRKARAG